MKQGLIRMGSLMMILIGSWGCGAPRILGKATLANGSAAPGAGTPAPGVTVNFINLAAAIEESVVSVETDAKGEYKSPELTPGKFVVEAMLPGHVIGKTTVVLGKHGSKKAVFALKAIGEAKSKSVNESESENIPTPGEVKIGPPR
jgi:hypothetical protein